MVLSIVVLLVIAVFGVYLTRTLLPGQAGPLSWVIVAVAVVIVAVRGFARRMRR